MGLIREKMYLFYSSNSEKNFQLYVLDFIRYGPRNECSFNKNFINFRDKLYLVGILFNTDGDQKIEFNLRTRKNIAQGPALSFLKHVFSFLFFLFFSSNTEKEMLCPKAIPFNEQEKINLLPQRRPNSRLVLLQNVSQP